MLPTFPKTSEALAASATGLVAGLLKTWKDLSREYPIPLAPLAPFRGEGPGVRGGLMCKLETRFVAFPRAHPPHPQPFSPTKPGEKGARVSVEPRTAQVPQSSMPDGFSSAQPGSRSRQGSADAFLRSPNPLKPWRLQLRSEQTCEFTTEQRHDARVDRLARGRSRHTNAVVGPGRRPIVTFAKWLTSSADAGASCARISRTTSA